MLYVCAFHRHLLYEVRTLSALLSWFRLTRVVTTQWWYCKNNRFVPSCSLYKFELLNLAHLLDFGLSRIKTSEGKVLYNERDPLKELYMPSTDFHSIAAWKPPCATSPEEKQCLSSFRRKLRQGIISILSRPFSHNPNHILVHTIDPFYL